jgi:parallel beta-helix repeat protein
MNKTAYRIMSFAVVFGLVFGASSPALASAAFEPAVQGDRAALLAAKVYYVSTTGRNTNPGTSTAPFKTFAKAVSVLTPGDTLQVQPGTYYEPLVITKSGTAAAPITVIGNGAILNMKGVEQTGMKIKGSYVNVSNFEVTGATDAGIGVSGKYVTVTNNIVHDNVTENGVNGKCGVATSWSSGLKVGVGGAHITIAGNTVYNNCGEGIAITRGVRVMVKNNTVYDNFAPNIYIDNSPYTTVRNNLVYCTGAVLRRDGKRPTGIGLGEEFYEGWGARMHHVVVAGNRVRNCGKGIGVFASEVGGTLTKVTITRNKVLSGKERPIALSTSPNKNVVISYNTLFIAPYISDKVGVTLIGNIIGTTSGQ